MKFLNILLNIDCGSIADWFSGILTFISVTFAFYLNLHRKKPNLNFELVNWPYEKNQNRNIIMIDSYSLLIQNEENYPLNIKIICNDNYWNEKIIHFPAISTENSKPVFLVIPLNFPENSQIEFTFQNLANKKKSKVTITKINDEISLYRGLNGIRQPINHNLKEDAIEEIKV